MIRLLVVGVMFLLSHPAVYAQDTTITQAAPGFTLYTIHDRSGPNFINVLEIDVTLPTTKITTALANDRLGHGFERTSALSGRKSQSGHIVVGAVNGDFYGITEPFNPYGFLIGSQIIENQFAYGGSNARWAFGVGSGSEAVLESIRFAGSFRAPNNEVYSINTVNGQRQADHLVLYNKYFGESTNTNQFGTEIRLDPIDEFLINGEVRFIASAIEERAGDMNIGTSDYVLSGHGDAESFLVNNVSIDDTLVISIGTHPDIGNVSELIGGGPRLVINGTRSEEATDGAIHPRTAAGINEDSTLVYFVTVDGRQGGFSDGMSLAGLADFLISFGIHNAVNLDGGGSTTMTIHDMVVNSPSDPGGERSVANALFAVSTVEISVPEIPLPDLPGDEAIDQRDTILFRWNAVEDAVSYNIQVSADPDFVSDIIIDKNILLDTVFTLTGLEGLSDYFWRVRSRNAAGISGFSGVRSFSTGFPVVPVLSDPPHATVGVSIPPTLSWHPAEAAASYRLQLSTARTIEPANTLLDTTGIADTLLSVPDLIPDRVYFWRVSALNEFGASGFSEVSGFRTAQATQVGDADNLPQEYSLYQNYPNPFNPGTNVMFQLPVEAHVQIDIYNVLGQHVETLVSDYKKAGIYSVQWNAEMHTSGIYYCVFVSEGGYYQSIPMILLR